MSIIFDKSKYRKRIIDITIETYFDVCGAICIEGPKRCGKNGLRHFIQIVNS